jgi:O-antigen ligase
MVDEPVAPPRRRVDAHLLAETFVRSPALAPCGVAVAVFVGWAGYQGGYPPTVWYPGGLLIGACLATALMISRRPFAGAPRLLVAALALLAGFTAWSYLSIIWADQRADAWDGANRTLLYLCVYALFSLWPWRPGAAAALMGLYAVGVAAVMGAYLARAAAADEPGEFLIAGRLAEPAGYPNANCALAMGAFFLASFLASRRELPWLGRALLLAAAGVTLELAILTQSRGSLVAVPLTALLALAIVPGRSRLLLSFAACGIVAFAFRSALLDVYPARDDAGTLHDALGQAGQAVGISAAILAVIGAAVALADRRIELSERGRRRSGLAVLAACLVVAAVGLAALVVAYGNPVTRAENAWSDFTAVRGFEDYLDPGSSRFSGGLGSNRWDFWRIAVDGFERSPLLGAGADNFALDYVRDRQSPEEPRYAHSVELRALGGLGIVGALLLTAGVACALAAAYRARRTSTRFGAALAAGCVVAFAYWLIHGTVDWFWEFPALAAPAFAWLGLAAGLARVPAAGEPGRAAAQPGPRRRRVVAPICLLALGLALLVSFVPPWLAARDVDRAAATWREDPQTAFEQLDRARSLNPLSERPDLVAGAIASRLGDLERMRAAFARALERNPRSWYALLELAVVDSNEGNFQGASRRLEQAAALNPREPALALARERLDAREPIPPDLLRRLFLDRVEALTS